MNVLEIHRRIEDLESQLLLEEKREKRVSLRSEIMKLLSILCYMYQDLSFDESLKRTEKEVNDAK